MSHHFDPHGTTHDPSLHCPPAFAKVTGVVGGWENVPRQATQVMPLRHLWAPLGDGARVFCQHCTGTRTLMPERTNR